MKRIILIILAVCVSCLSFAQADQKVADLINSNDYIELSRYYPSVKDSMSVPMLGIMVEAGIAHSLGNPKKAVASMTELINSYGGELGFDNVCSYIVMLSSELSKTGDHTNAVHSVKSVLDVCPVDHPMLLLLKSQYQKAKGSSLIPKSEISQNSDQNNRIKIEQNGSNIARHWYIPMEVNGKQELFLFDTGASHSFVSKEFAKRNNVRTVVDSIRLVGATGSAGYTALGFIDEVKVGNIAYSNLPVTIGDISLPSDENIDFVIDAIIGIPFMEAIGSIKVFPQEKEAELTYKVQTQVEAKNPDMMVFGGSLVVEANVEGSRLLLLCDTGAATEGWISQQASKKFVEKLNTKAGQLRYGSFGGGESSIEVLDIEKIGLSVGGKHGFYNDFMIVDNCQYFGELGCYFFDNHKEVQFDFRDMRLELSK